MKSDERVILYMEIWRWEGHGFYEDFMVKLVRDGHEIVLRVTLYIEISW